MPEPPVDGNNSSARADRSGETVVVPEVEALDNDAEYDDLRSVACAPMGKHGIVFMGQASRDGFDPFDLRLRGAVDYAAVVLHRLTRAQELLAAEEKAEQVNEMKSAFPANVSHEIRTPLTSVIGFAEAIREEVETGDTTVPQFADLIEQGGHRLLETLGAVSSLSKLEAEEVGVLFEQQAVDQMEGPSRSTRNRAWAPASSCDSPGQAAGRGHVEWAHGPNGPPGRLRAEHRLYSKRTTSWTCSSARST